MMNVFKDARIILPMRADAEELAKIERRIVVSFGGFTSYVGTGAWRAPDGHTDVEAVRVYDVAVPAFTAGALEDGNRAWHGASTELRAIAREACNRLEQACIYLRLPDGEVHLVGPNGRDFNPDTAPAVYPRASDFWRARNAGVM
jgi:hypothetical protein